MSFSYFPQVEDEEEEEEQDAPEDDEAVAQDTDASEENKPGIMMILFSEEPDIHQR